MTEIIKPSFFAKVFSPNCNKPYELLFDEFDINFNEDSINHNFNYHEISKINIVKGFIWSTAEIKTELKKSYFITGLNDEKVKKLKDHINDRKRNIQKVVDQISKNSKLILAISNQLDSYKSFEFWLSQYDRNSILEKIESFKTLLKFPHIKLPISKNLIKSFSIINEFIADTDKFKQVQNEQFVTYETKKFETFLNSVEKNSLNFEQREAIVTNEDNTLVVAAAGSGKTSLLVGKVGYLIKKNLANKDEILLLAFNRLAKEEIIDRLKRRLNIEVDCHTFHSFGLSIIAQSKQKKPSLAKFVESDNQFFRFIQKIINDIFNDQNHLNNIKKFFISYLRPYRDQFNFESQGQYLEYIKSNNLITLKGENVKSFEELEIANFLYINSINYQYESNYMVQTASVDKRQYQPDFYLPDYDIYIEHFAISRDNKTPFFINEYEYLSGIKWKRDLHQENNTTLIETYSYEKKENHLTESLESKLRKHNVILEPIDSKKLFSALNQEGYISEFAMIVSTFLNLYKSNNLNLDSIKSELKIDEDNIAHERVLIFLEIFKIIFEKYETSLKEEKEIDFHDMINHASKIILNEKNKKEYKYILIDEFQDISHGRANLIKSIQKANPHIKLLAVGDDWQSIYRFTGSDIGIMSNFSDYFGFTKRLFLTETFRYNTSIEKVASKFIQANPSQINKEIISKKESTEPQVTVFIPTKKTGRYLENIASSINKKNDIPKSCLILGRNNFNEEAIDYLALKKAAPNINFEFRTVHRAKGYEADYVILLDLRKGRNGFPNEIVDDPIISILLSQGDNYTFAEERRLFYVALTRAKEHVYLISDASSPSDFFLELITKDYFVRKLNIEVRFDRYCRECKTSHLLERMSAKGKRFFGCQNFPLCKYTSEPCQQCGIGYLTKQNDRFLCDNQKCNVTYQICPKCNDGALLTKKGPYGLFYGCDNFLAKNCSYTKKISGLS